jgi:phosphatidylglycerol---prolipoprotein diacylglyceryl transferase
MDRIAFSIFGIDIMWYGILMATGMIVATMIGLREAKRLNISEDDILNIVLVGIPAGIIGARLYYVIFEWDYYGANPSQILNFRGGGMAIHGALIGGFLAGYIYCRIKKMDFLKMADTLVIGIPLAQAIGRWGNFLNKEAHGGPTNLPWGIMVDGQKVHPTFLYESIWNVGVFTFLMLFRKNKKYEGEVTVLYIIAYSIGRFFVEGLRTDSLMLGPLRMAQVISLVGIIAAVIIHVYLSKKSKNIIDKKINEK